MSAALSFDQAPPMDVPYRFLLTAPWFGVAAGLLFGVYGDEITASRWSGASLAFIHLITAGFMLQAMCGALLQFIPVATGALVPAARPIATLTHAALLAGCLALAGAFLRHDRLLFVLAIPLLGGGGLFFTAAASVALWRCLPPGATLRALRIAIAGLAITLVIGLLMAAGLGELLALPLLEMTFAHAAAGLGAWSLVLLSGVCFYVVPMFQLTPRYPAWVENALPPVAGALALLAGSLELLGRPLAARSALTGLFALAAGFALLTLRLQARRRRRVTDPTFWFFRIGMLSGLAGAAIGMAHVAGRGDGGAPLLAVAAFLLLGALLSVINGMLYKIVPFINWLHLQRATHLAQPGRLMPTMKDMIAERAMQGQLACHLVALLLWTASPAWPALAPAAGIALALSSAWLGVNLAAAVRRYGLLRDRLRADA